MSWSAATAPRTKINNFGADQSNQTAVTWEISLTLRVSV